jgi:hypothetical protein
MPIRGKTDLGMHFFYITTIHKSVIKYEWDALIFYSNIVEN